MGQVCTSLPFPSHLVGGLGLINLYMWNKATVSKLCWDLAHKTDKLQIQQVHYYYVTSSEQWCIPNQASWIVRKIMSTKNLVDQMLAHNNNQKSMIRQTYLHLLGRQNRVQWKTLMFKNLARPKACFSMWLICHKRLLRLLKWGIDIPKIYSLC